jgi:hypothetical protein
MKPVEDLETIAHILSWVEYVASTKTSNGWPICPYARHALIKNRLKILNYDKNQCQSTVELFNNDIESFKVWVLICNDEDPKAECQQLNQLYPDIIWLYDLADRSLTIDQTKTGNQKYNLILMQDKNELISQSDIVKQQGYYSNWSTNNLNEIVNWRNDDQG